MTDFSTMTDDQLDGWLAVKVMGGNEFFSTTYALHNGRCWQPTHDLNQAVMCAEKWQGQSSSRWIEIQRHAYDAPPSLVDLWDCKLVDIEGGSRSLHKCLARALCEAIAMAVEGEG